MAECPDCKIQMQPINLIDATNLGLEGNGTTHVDLNYAATDATPSFLLRKIPAIGRVGGKICPDCGRILLFGEPYS